MAIVYEVITYANQRQMLNTTSEGFPVLIFGEENQAFLTEVFLCT